MQDLTPLCLFSADTQTLQYYATQSASCVFLSGLGGCDSVPVHIAPEERGPSRSQTAQLVNLGTLLFACVAVGLAGGYFADRWIGGGPGRLLSGLAGGA